MTEKAYISPFMYYVLIDIHPNKSDEYLHWLSTKHITDVVNSPWVLWGRKVALEQKAEDGWKRIMVVYGFPSKKDFEEYRASELFKSFAEEMKPFAEVFRITRMFGQIDLVLEG